MYAALLVADQPPMCIISKPAHVAKTEIFVALNATLTRQLTVYSNQVATEAGAVMILPVPDPASVRLIDLSGYAKIFDDLNEAFRQFTFSASSAKPPSSSATLSVVRVGGYLVTIVPNAGEFGNLSLEIFGEVNRSLALALAARYPNMGFVACKLNNALTKYHPIAYEHVAENKQLFVPTYHLHDHRGEFAEEKTAHWDHKIFSLNTIMSGRDESRRSSLARHKIPFAFPAKDVLVKRTLVGYAPNADTILQSSIG